MSEDDRERTGARVLLDAGVVELSTGERLAITDHFDSTGQHYLLAGDPGVGQVVAGPDSGGRYAVFSVDEPPSQPDGRPTRGV